MYISLWVFGGVFFFFLLDMLKKILLYMKLKLFNILFLTLWAYFKSSNNLVVIAH